MALEITYWSGTGSGGNIARALLSSEQRSLSGSSAQSGATPDAATVVSIVATEKARFGYGNNPSVTDAGTSAVIMSGERIWLEAFPGFKVAGIQAA